MGSLGTNCTVSIWNYNRLLKDAHLLRSPHFSSLRRTSKYVSLLRISGALHPGIFEQPDKRLNSYRYVKFVFA